MDKKVLVALSGGVDSSVSAFLLKQRGFDVVGATMKLFSSERSLHDIKDAEEISSRLNVKHYTFDISDTFRVSVIQKFIETYQKGATPNPCVDCNKHIKFGEFLSKAKELGCKYVATGHYAQVEKSGDRFLLKKASDIKKDQSYVLYVLTQEQLACVIFPLGNMTKEKVRELALSHNFINAKKSDSQDICFVPDGDYVYFIEEYTGQIAESGNIVDEKGNILGTHQGIIRYTIGQRKGLGISFSHPRYVLSKSADTNAVVLGEEESLYTKSLIADNINLIAYSELQKPIHVKVKTRYLQTEQDATVEQISADKIRIDFTNQQRAITIGQSAVLYDGDIVVGGGTIISSV